MTIAQNTSVGSPSPGAQARADLSPTGRGGVCFAALGSDGHFGLDVEKVQPLGVGRKPQRIPDLGGDIGLDRRHHGARPRLDVEPGLRADSTTSTTTSSWGTAMLLDHLVGAQQNRRRNPQSDGSCRGYIDDQLELGRLIDRHLPRLGAFEDLIDVAGRAPV